MTQPGGHEFDDVVRMPLVTSPGRYDVRADYPVSSDTIVNVVEGVVVRPDDTLIIRYDTDCGMDDAEFASLKARLQDALQDQRMMVLCADELAVVRTDDRIERIRALCRARQAEVVRQAPDGSTHPGWVDDSSIRPSEILAILDGKD